jgi:hypothetical protein
MHDVEVRPPRTRSVCIATSPRRGDVLNPSGARSPHTWSNGCAKSPACDVVSWPLHTTTTTPHCPPRHPAMTTTTAHQVRARCHVAASTQCAQPKRLRARSPCTWSNGRATSPARDNHGVASPATSFRGARTARQRPAPPATSSRGVRHHDDGPHFPPRCPAALVHSDDGPALPATSSHAHSTNTRRRCRLCVQRYCNMCSICGTETLEGTRLAALTRNPRLGYGLWGGSRSANPYPDPTQPYPPTPRVSLTRVHHYLVP